MQLVANSEASDPRIGSSPPRNMNRALGVTATPGGSLMVTGEIPIHQTPSGSVRPLSNDDEVPLCSDILEKVEAMELSEDEAEELVKNAPWHVRRWVTGSSFPPALAEPNAEARPSTSGVTGTAATRETCQGSDLDSEFDDEFDGSPVETTALTGFRKDIPGNEELEEPARDIIINIERGIDDEADRLLGMSTSFDWVEGFENFRGVPENFSGPTPGPVRDYDSPYDAFTDIWDKSIIERIVTETNRYAQQTIAALESKGQLKPSSRLREWTDMNADEIMVLFAIYMYMAINPRSAQAEYWARGILEMP
ncbi:uncharacterized protein LOC142985807 [Anticarsia gemmatalis]|uniref:uncharacterized protein LOC142985807 n=1 Tax=Anticarsia gemmatalis TaxID=129554 RepID=UPI003F7744A4